MGSVVYTYRVAVDSGLAPCVQNGILTLACCKGGWKTGVKTGLRYWSGEYNRNNPQSSIYVVGYIKGDLLYAAHINECMPMKKYYSSDGASCGRLDDIYDLDCEGVLRRNDKCIQYHNDSDQYVRDISGEYVLLSRDFAYFGNKSKTFGKIDDCRELRSAMPIGRETKRIYNSNSLVDQIESIISKYRNKNCAPCTQLLDCNGIVKRKCSE